MLEDDLLDEVLEDDLLEGLLTSYLLLLCLTLSGNWLLFFGG